ncbi:MAG TPA: serine/threonine-protein kinase [Ktedonobacteraceae bacterium]|nr:serine/threonine-protein kinase [Ktedonobacteraceae bacterium]
MMLLSAYLAAHILFEERYEIIDELGSGGFGLVYKARDILRANNLVAIKEVCLRGLTPRETLDAVSSYQREAELLSQLTHPSLPHLYERILMPEQWCLVMDYIEGETLDEYQKKVPNKRLMLSEVFAIGQQLCEVLEYLHTHQPPIVFRDLKPANIIRAPDGKLYLIDFGIARFFKPGQVKDTIALGSLGYAAPEQYGKIQTTPRADIYALGAVLHQMLTGNDPSEAPLRLTPLRGKHATAKTDPGSLTSSMVNVLMESLGKLIDSMLEMDINKRPISVTLVKVELDDLAAIWSEIVGGFVRPRIPRTSQRHR